MRLLFKVQEATETTDSSGTPYETWSDQFRITGEVKALKGGQQIRALGQDTKATHRITTHYDSRLDESKRLVVLHDTSRIFNIQFVENVEEKNRKMILLVEEWRDKA